MPNRGKGYIRASEIGAYVYCRRAWWLKRVAGFTPDDRGRFLSGEIAHARHGQIVRRTLYTRLLALACFVLAAILIILAVLLLVF